VGEEQYAKSKHINVLKDKEKFNFIFYSQGMYLILYLEAWEVLRTSTVGINGGHIIS
jgi:hypothetical protein